MDKEKIKLDRMRYVKDSVPSNLAIIAVVFDILYFVLIYKINNEFFYNFSIGASVVVNLLFMLFGFWCSIEVKNYHGKFGYLMIFLGLVQIARIFYYPMQAHNAIALSGEVEVQVMNNTQFIMAIAYLVISAASMICGGLLSMKNSKTLQNYLGSLQK